MADHFNNPILRD